MKDAFAVDDSVDDAVVGLRSWSPCFLSFFSAIDRTGVRHQCAGIANQNTQAAARAASRSPLRSSGNFDARTLRSEDAIREEVFVLMDGVEASAKDLGERGVRPIHQRLFPHKRRGTSAALGSPAFYSALESLFCASLHAARPCRRRRPCRRTLRRRRSVVVFAVGSVRDAAAFGRTGAVRPVGVDVGGADDSVAGAVDGVAMTTGGALLVVGSDDVSVCGAPALETVSALRTDGAYGRPHDGAGRESAVTRAETPAPNRAAFRRTTPKRRR